MNKNQVLALALASGIGLAVLLLAATQATADSTIARPMPPDGPEPGAFSLPAASLDDSWSSGWFYVPPASAQILSHSLGGDPDDYLIQVWFWDNENDGDADIGINVRGYGGYEGGGNFYGATWQNLTDETVQVFRYSNDTAADMILVRIWIPDDPADYCSDWTDIAQGTIMTFTHNLGGDVDDYSVGLVFSSTVSTPFGPAGRNHRFYGGLEYGGGANMVGAYWDNLTDSTVRVYRHANDLSAEQVRLCVTIPDPPAYDSGWVTVTANSVTTLTHNVGGMLGPYRVRLDQWNPASGINHYCLGGEAVNVTPTGANWENLTDETIAVLARGGISRVRIRIWNTYLLYLPIVVNDYTGPTELAYDDGIADSWQSHDPDSGFAVLFHTDAAAQLTGARFYLDAASGTAPIEVHVWDAAHNDLITPFETTPPNGEGWFDVDLSSYSLTVDGDFYVGFTYPEASYDPSIGVDSSAPDGYSYEVPWILMTDRDYMIRATIGQ
ncbi:MAG: hypothetical protein JW900_01605 [Anaerolineae bacterium]|nr:hypothetical protein [Anaerolineae bacterium]